MEKLRGEAGYHLSRILKYKRRELHIWAEDGKSTGDYSKTLSQGKGMRGDWNIYSQDGREKYQSIRLARQIKNTGS